MKRRAFLFACCAVAPVARLRAQIFGVGATEITQLLNHAQLLAQYATQIQIALNTLSIAQQAIQAGRVISRMDWSNIQSDLFNIAFIARAGQGIAFSLQNLDRQFRTTFPGYGQPSASAGRPPTRPFFDQYRDWSQTTLDSIYGSLRAANLSWQQYSNEQEYRNYLQVQARSAAGQMQATTVGNQIGIETLNSLGRLRTVFLADMQSKEAYQAYQVQRNMSTAAFEQNFYGAARVVGDGRRF